MKNFKIVVLSLTLALVCGTASAKGCLKGAAIGGLVGHVAGRHGLLGAVGGCLVNTKLEKDKAQKAKADKTKATHTQTSHADIERPE